MKFNINDKVRIKLQEAGLQELQQQHDEIYGLFPNSIPKEMNLPLDEDGYYEIQLWQLMSKFGHLMHIGSELPFETDIIIPNKRGEDDC